MFGRKDEGSCGSCGQCSSCGWPAALMKSKGGQVSRITVKGPKGSKEPLFLRGEGAGLSWNKGVRLDHVRGNSWSWETKEPFQRVEFKVLINDMIWEEGPNHLLESGKTVEYSAKFPA